MGAGRPAAIVSSGSLMCVCVCVVVVVVVAGGGQGDNSQDVELQTCR